MKNKVYLIGFMGSGKSSLARLLAEKLAWKSVDLDAMIEQESGQTIAGIFASAGEKAFRVMEEKKLLSTAEYHNTVIALGGGACCSGKAIDFITSQGCVVYLQLSAEVLLERLLQDKEKRPLISAFSGNELSDYINKTLSVRKTYYERAHIISGGEGLEDLIRQIKTYLR